MADLKTIALSKIQLGDRLRDIDEGQAEAIAASISEHGLINPISIRSTPASKGGSYTIIAGAHRYRALQLLDFADTECFVFKVRAEEAQLLELTENLHRNELSALDRAAFVNKYREIFEQTVGKIERHSERNPWGQLVPSDKPSFSAEVGMRLGLHPRSAKRLNQIAQKLHPQVKAALRNTPIADNQSQLLKLARMPQTEQKRIARAYSELGDFSKAVSLASDKPKVEPDKDLISYAALLNAWEKATPAARDRFLKELDDGSANEQEREAA